MNTLERQSSFSFLLPNKSRRPSPVAEEADHDRHNHNGQRLTSSSLNMSAMRHNNNDNGPLHQRRVNDADPTVTASTLFSVSTSPAGAAPSTSSSRREEKKSLRDRFNFRRRLPGFLKRNGKKRSSSEARLRKKLRKALDREDWDGARRLISGHEFSSDVAESWGGAGGGFDREGTSRRPSYGSPEQRRSFTGSFTGESAAAAAVIKAAKAAALEEGSGGSGCDTGGDHHPPSCGCHNNNGGKHHPNPGENILHDACRRRPPLDVLETLLAALRHRRRCTTATDGEGRTPLHLAAASGADPALIDALVRADPSPASMGDDGGRSPLHLAVRRLADPAIMPSAPQSQQKRSRDGKRTPSSSREERLERTLQTARILKEAMLSYPGRVNFKDEDAAGFSPLDYAIDADVQSDDLITTLLRRKEPKCHRTSRKGGRRIPPHRGSNNNLTEGRSVYSNASSSGAGEDLQDIEVLQRLEADEIDARRRRIEGIKEERRREEREARVNDALFDVFGISRHEEETRHAGETRQADELPLVDAVDTAPRLPADDRPHLRAAQQRPPDVSMVEDEAAIYARHMQDYLDEYMDDFEGGCGLEGGEDEDGFDIFADPEEGHDCPPQATTRTGNIIDGPPIAEIVVSRDDDCVSLVSEVTVPLVALSQNHS